MKPNQNQGQGQIPYGPKKKPRGRVRGAGRPAKPHSGRPKPNPRLDNPAAFTQPRTLRSVLGDANQSANLRYGGQERALGLQAQQVPVWYAQYQTQLKGIGQGIQQGYQKGAADVMAQTQQNAASDTTARNSLASTMQQDAASRGATVDPSLLANDVNAANVRNTNQSAFAGLLGAQGQAQGTYYGGLQTAGAAGELGQKTRIGQEQAGVATDKGNYKSQYVSDARDTERKYGLEAQAFGLDTARAAAAAAAPDQKVITSGPLTGRTQKWVRRHPNAAAQLVRQGARKPGKVITSGALTGRTDAWVRQHPQQANKLVADYNASKAKGKTGKPKAPDIKTKATIRTGVARVRAQDVNRPGYWDESYNTLINTDGLDPVVARAIIQGARVGHLGPQTAKTLREDYGITNITFPKPKKRKGSSSGPGGGPHGTNRP